MAGDSFFVSDKKRKRPARAGSSSGSRGGGSGRGGSAGRGGSGGRGRGTRGRGGAASSRGQNRHDERDEDVSSAESDVGDGDIDLMDFRKGREDIPLDDEDIVDENETAAEKRIRLAKGYLAKVKDDLETARNEEDYDAADIDRELIASRLQKDVAETQGRIHTYLAASLGPAKSRLVTTPSHAPTSVAISTKALFIATKRGSIMRYSLPELRKVGKPFGQAQLSGPKAKGGENGHQGEILCLAASEDGKYLVSGGRDRIVGVWNVEDDEVKWISGMRGHKDAITAISLPALDNPSYHILTASLSRHLALASLTTLSVIDTFFGHQDSITDVSSLKPSVAVTAGSRDRTCRWWKVEEEVQLVFRGGGRTFENYQGIAPNPLKERLGGGWEEEKAEDAAKRKELEKKGKGKGREFVEGSIDCVCMVDDQHFVSGGDSGSISLWHTGKKKPIFTKPFAHGIDDLTMDHEMKGARWITSLASLRGSDLFASGSWDGEIRLWAIDPSLRSFAPASTHTLPTPGFINSIQFISLASGGIDSSSWHAAETLEGKEETTEEAAPVKANKSQVVLVAAASQEPRLGRWMRDKTAKNGAFIVELSAEHL